MKFGLDQMKMAHAPHMFPVKGALLPAFSDRVPLNKRISKFSQLIGRIGNRILKMRNSFIEGNALDKYEGGR